MQSSEVNRSHYAGKQKQKTKNKTTTTTTKTQALGNGQIAGRKDFHWEEKPYT